MITRIWRSYTTPDNAEAYEHLLDTLMFPAIEGLRIPGYKNMELLRRMDADEVEFIWVINFDNTAKMPRATQGRGRRSGFRAARRPAAPYPLG